MTLKVGVSEAKEGPMGEAEQAAYNEHKQMHRIDSLRALSDNVESELLFLRKKMQVRQRSVNQSLVTNFVVSQTRPFPGAHT